VKTEDAIKIAKQFNVYGNVVECEKHSLGLINDTFIFITERRGIRKKYILQKINDTVFHDVDALMKNLCAITEFCKNKILISGGNPDRETLTVTPTKDGKPYFICDGLGCFRVFPYIENTITHKQISSPEQFYKCAVAFGNFALMLNDFDTTTLYATLPNFHNTQIRFDEFMKALKLDTFDRAKEVEELTDFILARRDYANKLQNLIDNKQIPVRVAHYDTKLNNVLFDASSDEPVAVIDLDTVSAGSILFDFGDAVRGGANTVNEDELDLAKVNFDLALFESFTKGYLSVVKSFLTPVEIDNLAFSVKVITYELGMRFLTDYLNGDVYFKTTYEKQNLQKAKVQFTLLSEMEKVYDKMLSIVEKYR